MVLDRRHPPQPELLAGLHQLDCSLHGLLVSLDVASQRSQGLALVLARSRDHRIHLQYDLDHATLLSRR